MTRPRTHAKAAPAGPPARTAPVLQLHRCTGCGAHYPLLVEGTDLCMGCDRITYPGLAIA